ncbi:MAG: type III secretion system chaperone [Gemmatales bacterium]
MKLFSMLALFTLIGSAGSFKGSKCSAQTPDPGESTVTEETLKSQLQSLGYNIDVYGNGTTDHPTIYLAKVSRGNRIYPVRVQFGGDKSIIWLTVDLIKIEKPELSGGRLRRLMERSYNRGGSFFEYDAPAQILMLARSCDNRGVTAKVLDNKIERMLDNVEATRSEWEVDWSAPLTTASRQAR